MATHKMRYMERAEALLHEQISLDMVKNKLLEHCQLEPWIQVARPFHFLLDATCAQGPLITWPS